MPTKKDEITRNDNWEIPNSVDIFSNCEEIRPKCEIDFEARRRRMLHSLKKDKNGKSELSTPERTFITQLENSDDYLQWWYKNGKSEK